MKKKLGFLIVLCLLVVTLFMPMAKVNVHSSVDVAQAALFPAQISLFQVLLHGSGVLPVKDIPALSMAQLGQLPLIIGCVLMLLAVAVVFVRRKGTLQASMLLGAVSCVFFFSFATQVNNTASSLLFGYLL